MFDSPVLGLDGDGFVLHAELSSRIVIVSAHPENEVGIVKRILSFSLCLFQISIEIFKEVHCY